MYARRPETCSGTGRRVVTTVFRKITAPSRSDRNAPLQRKGVYHNNMRTILLLYNYPPKLYCVVMIDVTCYSMLYRCIVPIWYNIIIFAMFGTTWRLLCMRRRRRQTRLGGERLSRMRILYYCYTHTTTTIDRRHSLPLRHCAWRACPSTEL